MLLLLALLFHFVCITAINVIHNSSHLRSYSHTSLYFIHTHFFKWLFSLCFMGKYCPCLTFCIAHWFFLLKQSDLQTGFAPVQYLTLMEIWQQIPRRISENSSFGIVIAFSCSLSPLFFCLKFFLESSTRQPLCSYQTHTAPRLHPVLARTVLSFPPKGCKSGKKKYCLGHIHFWCFEIRWNIFLKVGIKWEEGKKEIELAERVQLKIKVLLV